MRGIANFVRFVLCGGVAACVNFALRWLLSHWLSYPAAIVLAYLAGMVTAFLLFKVFVFNRAQSKRAPREALGFIAVNVFSLLQTLGISLWLAGHVFPRLGMGFYPYEIAHGIGLASLTITSFWGHKCLTFKKERQCD